MVEGSVGFCWGCWGRGAILMGSLERSGGVLVETWGASMSDSTYDVLCSVNSFDSNLLCNIIVFEG